MPSHSEKKFLAESNLTSIGTVNTINDRPTIIFSDAETQSLAANFCYALVGKFWHGSPPYNQLHRLLSNSGIKEAFIVSLINNKHALINLTNEADYSRLWMRRIWYLKGLPMRVFKWAPTFIPDQESSIVPVWVSFPDLPAYLFRKDALHTIANFVGTPLQIADSTFSRSMFSRAHICIEIDLLKPLVKEFDLQINGRTCTFGTNEATTAKQTKDKNPPVSMEKGGCSKTPSHSIAYESDEHAIVHDNDENHVDEVNTQLVDVENEAQIVDVMPENDACFVENETIVEHAIVDKIENENENVEGVETLGEEMLSMIVLITLDTVVTIMRER
ncbi:UNVERIFIED_CONTAM: hypothetical protein Sradi_3240100 [Sesamum radiatum]|uniref:DUF4283 domain-containing protein n=1 Tax=Sesamum radiatum TaxID=300843 RepID=A0AAW2RIN9_SESRA